MPLSRRDAPTIAAGVGVVSGLLSYFVHIERYQVDGGNHDAVVSWLLLLWPGIIYGIAIGLYLKSMGVATILRAALFVPLDTAAWFVAFWFANAAAYGFETPFKVWQIGIVSGSIGAGLVALSALLLFPFFRRWDLVVAMIVVGGAAGVLLSVGAPGWNLIILFPVWQGAVAACFGWAVARAKGTS